MSMDDDAQEPDLKRPISENMRIMMLSNYVEDELRTNASGNTRKQYTNLQMLCVMMENHAEGYPALGKYMEEKKKLDDKYGNPKAFEFVMRPQEAMERWKLVQKLGKDIGTFFIGSRNELFPSSRNPEEDFIAFSGFWEEN